MANEIQESTKGLKNIRLHGKLENEEVKKLMARSSFQIVPSNAYETFGMVVVEAFSVGTPVIVSDHGSLSELVEHEKTGFKFEPGNSSDLKEQVLELANDSDLQSKLGKSARMEYQQKYTKEANYQLLQKIYRDAIEEVRK